VKALFSAFHLILFLWHFNDQAKISSYGLIFYRCTVMLDILEALHCSSKILLFLLQGNNDANTCAPRMVKHFIKKAPNKDTKEAIIV
jgi:hypothetical protein